MTVHVIYHVVLPMKMCLHHNFSTTEPIWMILLSTESSWLSDFKYTRFWVGYSNKFLQMSDKLLTQAWEWLHKKVKKSLRKWHVHLGLNEEISDKLISWESVKKSASYGSLKFKEYCRKGLFGRASGKLHKPNKPSQDLSTPHKAMQEAGCLHRGYKRKHLLARGHQSSYGV